MSNKLRSMKKKNKGSWKLTRQMSRDHEDVLQNIESALVIVYRDMNAVDDRAALAALEAALHNRQTNDPIVEGLVGSLNHARRLRGKIPDDIWHDCLRVVISSVRRHSSLKPGDVGYLSFVAEFIK
ncbi:MAG TPA: hypothetical protein VM223_04065 [Planctomycetota bacterium]|nr:hypothetical protein [Planctomycetota bacterium]